MDVTEKKFVLSGLVLKELTQNRLEHFWSNLRNSEKNALAGSECKDLSMGRLCQTVQNTLFIRTHPHPPVENSLRSRPGRTATFPILFNAVYTPPTFFGRLSCLKTTAYSSIGL